MYRALAFQPNKGLAGLCKKYHHYYSCVRFQNPNSFLLLYDKFDVKAHLCQQNDQWIPHWVGTTIGKGTGQKWRQKNSKRMLGAGIHK